MVSERLDGSALETKRGPEKFRISLLRVWTCLFLYFLSWVGAAAQSPKTPNLSSNPLSPTDDWNASRLFTRIPPEETGISLVHRFPPNPTVEVLQDQRSGMGVCIGDYDEDGWPDLYISNFNQGNRLYRNLGNWRFEDVTATAGVEARGSWGGGVNFVDVDKDGDLDLYICVFNGPNLLYINNGNGTFQNEAKSRGIDFHGASVMMAFDDFDRDGDLDGYLVTARLGMDSSHGLPRNAKEALQRGFIKVGADAEISVAPAFSELFATMKKPNGRSELIIAGQPDRFYRNVGGGRFEEVGGKLGFVGNDIGLAATWWDYNGDSYPDLYVSNDYKGSDRLYRNKRGQGFEEVSATVLPAVPYASMGSDIADVNNDGWLDFFATDMAGSTRSREVMNYSDLARDIWFLQTVIPRQYRRNMLFLGTGTERVFEAAHLARLEGTDWTWSPKFADLDNDGWIDLFIANGMSRDFVNRDTANTIQRLGDNAWVKTPMLLERNFAFRNMGSIQFENVSARWGLDLKSASYGAALGDLDRDGDLDLVVCSYEAPVAVYRNNETKNHRVAIRLKGTRSDSWGIGARIQLESGGLVQTRQLTSASGFMSANEPIVYFGCGTNTRISRVTVEWPSGILQTFSDLKTGQFYTITEAGERTHQATSFSRQQVFKPFRGLAGLAHVEQPFDDFSIQPLLPWQLSQLGPGLACEDANGDGLEDIFLGGSAGQPGSLYLRQKNGNFVRSPQKAFELDRTAEDMGCMFFDSDSDGDMDLYVVSGGVEAGTRVSQLQDRLYTNNGSNVWVRASKDHLPAEQAAGSVVCAADFDHDGDLDLFVGGRCAPGRYPEPGTSRLLRNEQGKFRDVSEEIAPGLKNCGMVTSALWSDANNDGWADLFITREWGSILLYRNKKGQFMDVSTEAGLDGLSGCWNSIAGGDLDNDGDIDYVVGNLGLNTQYRGNREKPFHLFFGDFENRGQVDILEAYYEGERLFPVRGKTTLSENLPGLFSKYITFADFGEATIPDILGPNWEKVPHFKGQYFQSGVLRNDGTGNFEFLPLPPLAQLAPVFGIVISDFDGDGKSDIVLVQHFSGPRPETGKMNGGGAVLLKGIGQCAFEQIWPAESGLEIYQDARGAVAADLNEDNSPDLAVAINNGPLVGYVTRGKQAGRSITVSLKGRPGNPRGVGSRLEVIGTDGSRQTAEMYAGSGYLSQSPGHLFFSVSEGTAVKEIRVRWPDGTVTAHRANENATASWELKQSAD